MRIVAIVAVSLTLVGVAVYFSMCPCGPIPGAWLFGDKPAAGVTDWSFANDRDFAPLCQVQITTWRPHSINLNCMSDDGALFVSCSNCAGKRWSNDAISHPAGHIRVGSTVYPVTLTRVTDAATLDRIWQARLRKVQGESAPRPEHWWSFELAAR